MGKRVIEKKENLYWVDVYNNGFCYRSVHSCTWEEVKQIRKNAKMLGETIKYDKM